MNILIHEKISHIVNGFSEYYFINRDIIETPLCVNIELMTYMKYDINQKFNDENHDAVFDKHKWHPLGKIQFE